MSETVAAPAPRGRFHVRRILLWTLGIAVLAATLDVLGWDVADWLRQLWDVMTDISLQYLVAGIVFQTAQTTLTALAWLPILRYAYPDAEIPFKPVLAAYAIGVALNGFLPANIGSFVMLFIFLTFIPGSSFAGVFAGWLVHKIFFTIAGAFVYIYLFLSVPGSFDIELGNRSDNPVSVAIILVGGVLLLVAVARMFWKRSRASGSGRKTGSRDPPPPVGLLHARLLRGVPMVVRGARGHRHLPGRAPPFQGVLRGPPKLHLQAFFVDATSSTSGPEVLWRCSRGAFLDNKIPISGIFSLAKPSDGLEPSTPSLPWGPRQQALATHCNGLRVSEPFSAGIHLPPVATGCARSAP